MRVTGSRAYSRPAPAPKMPVGLVEMMEGLTKDVLKNNPPDVYAFCAEHMLKLLEIRDGPSTVKKLTLEQKILRAQEKVKKRAEHRWRRYKKEVQEKVVLENVSEANLQHFAGNENITLPVVKPVYHDDHDLTHTSEIEISCESGNDCCPGQVHCDEESNNLVISGNKSVLSSEIIPSENQEHKDDEYHEIFYQNVVDDGKMDPNSSMLRDNYISLENNNDNIKQYQDFEDRHEHKDKTNELHNKTENFNTIPLVTIDSEEPASENNKNKQNALEERNVLQDASDLNINDLVIKDNHESYSEVDKNFQHVCDDKNGLNDTTVNLMTTSSVSVDKDDTNGDNETIGDKCCNVNDVNSQSESLMTIDKIKSSQSDETEQVGANEKNQGNTVNSTATPSDEVEENIKNGTDAKISAVACDIHDSNGANNLTINSGIAETLDQIATDYFEPDTILTIVCTGESHTEFKETTNHAPEENICEVSINDNIRNDTSNTASKASMNVQLTNQSENEDDLENVLNEAIKNINRKDSSSVNETIKENNQYNEDETETSKNSSEDMTTVQDVVNHFGNSENYKKSMLKETKLINANMIKADSITENASHGSIRSKREVEASAVSDNSTLVINGDGGDDIDGNNSSIVIKSEHCNEVTGNELPNAMDLETAAVTIQKVFRTFLFKSRASTFDETVNGENNLSDDDEKKDKMQFLSNNINKERRTLGISRMDTVLQTVNEEKSLSLSTDDSSLSSAATIIQAHVRGFLVRNKLHTGKTNSSNSLAISNEPSSTSMEGDAEHNKNKTILNIHIVPEGGNYLSRDESMITSMDLSLDGSPPSSVNLHPLGYNTSERRKLLKREDAVQSVSPPSNNSGKLSEDVDSIKEVTITDNENGLNQDDKVTMASLIKDNSQQEAEVGSLETTPTNSLTIETVVGDDNKTTNTEMLSSPEPVTESPEKSRKSLTKQSSDEMDVVTPFKDSNSPRDVTHQLLHSGEFHDAPLPTKVSRNDTPVASEFKNVLVYFLLWNKTTRSSF